MRASISLVRVGSWKYRGALACARLPMFPAQECIILLKGLWKKATDSKRDASVLRVRTLLDRARISPWKCSSGPGEGAWPESVSIGPAGPVLARATGLGEVLR